MANHAASTQLPIMVRKPKLVWPGLVKFGLYQKTIAGDGNCLFASLSDQMFGTPNNHLEIRANIVEHMRTFRPLFELYVSLDDIHRRRALRSTIRKESEDGYEEYLRNMSMTGTYGGEPELVAFTQVYDQDVTVHLPHIPGFDKDSITYKNEHREAETQPSPIHICYGGDEVTRAHYNSARNRDGSHPRSQNSPRLDPQDSRRSSMMIGLSSSPPSSLSARAIRNSRSDLSSELIYDLLQKGRKDVEGSLDQLNSRARSPSVSSSHRSSSSKRSLEDDGDNPRRKRADRRKSTRKRTDMATVSVEPDNDISFRLQIDSPSPNTPASTQDTERSSEPPESGPVEHEENNDQLDKSVEDGSDLETSRGVRARRSKTSTKDAIAMHPKKAASTPGPTQPIISMTERPIRT